MIISGKELATQIKGEIQAEIEELKKKNERLPKLVVILVGENPASQSYVRGKERDAIEVGMENITYRLKEDTSKEEILSLIEKLNQDSEVDGILVQLPLPKHLNEEEILNTISPDKDVDGFHPVNMENILAGHPTIVPCTPKGIMEIFKRYNISLAGKHAVVIGRSQIVGKPISLLLLNENCTVTMCHSKTVNLSQYTSQADILICAVGKPKMITGNMVKNGAVVIDVGINRVEGHLVGDVDFESVEPVASYITPVPGGVGLLTRASLLQNCMELYHTHRKNE